MQFLRVNNIKVSCKIEGDNIRNHLKEFSKSSKLVTLVKNNFFVLRQRYVYVIFFAGHVNITKLKSKKDVRRAQKILLLSVGSSLSITTPEIDNISASGVAKSGPINLFTLAKYLNERNYKFRFNPHRFPGLNLRIKTATFVIFTSGKFVLVGTKSKKELVDSIASFCGLVKANSTLKR